eukprot:1253494-Alexandrium_andersonii.AAC.1
MGLLTVVPIPVVLGCAHSDTVDAGDAGGDGAIPMSRWSGTPGPCCAEPKGVDALDGGLGGGAASHDAIPAQDFAGIGCREIPSTVGAGAIC